MTLSAAVKRRWEAGRYLMVDQQRFRVVAGRKFPGDLVLEWNVDGSWVRLRMASAFLLVDFLAENEDARTPFMRRWREPGGDFFMRYVQAARFNGWESAAAEVRAQRQRLEEDD